MCVLSIEVPTRKKSLETYLIMLETSLSHEFELQSHSYFHFHNWSSAEMALALNNP